MTLCENDLKDFFVLLFLFVPAPLWSNKDNILLSPRHLLYLQWIYEKDFVLQSPSSLAFSFAKGIYFCSMPFSLGGCYATFYKRSKKVVMKEWLASNFSATPAIASFFFSPIHQLIAAFPAYDGSSLTFLPKRYFLFHNCFFLSLGLYIPPLLATI